MATQVTSVFLYVDDIQKSLEFYNEIMRAEITQLHAEHEGGPLTLAILKIGNFSMMLHPQEEHAQEFASNKPGLGIHIQIRVDNVDDFHQHCIDEGAMLAVLGEPVDQPWGWREFALKDPDGYIWSIYQDNSGGQWT
jgi:uncharacterized glyoxalase superfamily protein PhnB